MKYAIDHGMIDLSYVQEQIEMNKRQELLEKHPYRMWEGKDGKWRTYLPNEEEGCRLIKRSTRKSLEDEVMDYWKEELENPTIKEVFEEWNDRKLELKKISLSTHHRNKQIFRRHYEEFGDRKIKSVDPEEYEELNEYPQCWNELIEILSNKKNKRAKN